MQGWNVKEIGHFPVDFICADLGIFSRASPVPFLRGMIDGWMRL
jgi:hypothetical protein